MSSVPSLVDDDEATLIRLTKQSQSLVSMESSESQQQSLTLHNFHGLSSRFIEDIASPSCEKYHKQFWEETVSRCQSLGFTFDQSSGFDSGTQTNATQQARTDKPIEFDSAKGKSHLDAISLLLGVSTTYAKLLTSNVIELKGLTASTSLGSKDLLLLVRDYYYEQQISRIRFITESLRRENAEEEDQTVKESCSSFLDDLDKRTLMSSSSTSGKDRKRGLFKVLICIACAPVQTFSREELHKSEALLVNEEKENNMNGDQRKIVPSFAKKNVSHTSRHDFAKDLMERHDLHYNCSLRTEALEALFMLLYQRIHGGISRGDYILLLLALEKQHFFTRVHSNRKDNRNPVEVRRMRRRSQLSALLLAECMNLLDATTSIDKENWIESNALLSGGDANIVHDQLIVIGDCLFNHFASKVLERKAQAAQVGLSNDEGDEAPESIAILTFGLLLAMAHEKLASSQVMKDLAMSCVSLANNELGAFDYLGKVMTCFLPPQSTSNGFKVKNQRQAYNNDGWKVYALGDSVDGMSQVSPLTEKDGQKYFDTQIEDEDDASIVTYASIGREIVLGTLCAFRSTISIANEENIAMLCNLASKFYRNNYIMCEQFWGDWDAFRQIESNDRKQKSTKVDPFCLLLDVSYDIANRALTQRIESADYPNSVAMNNGRIAATMLPSLEPLLVFVSSLTYNDGNFLHQILRSFFSNGIIHASLLGCLHLCSIEESCTNAHKEFAIDYERLIESARKIMCSLNTMVSLIQEDDIDCVDFLRAAIMPEWKNDQSSSLWRGNGAELLQKVASSAYENVNLKPHASSDITSSSLSIIRSLCHCKTEEDLTWIDQVSRCFTGRTGNIKSFANSSKGQVKHSCVQLIYTMSSYASTVVMSSASDHETILHYLKFVEIGGLIACEMIASSSLSLELQDPEKAILRHSMRSIQTLLSSLDNIALCHRDEYVRSKAAQLRDATINNLSSSSALGTAIGFFATCPIASGLLDSLSRGDNRFHSSSGEQVSKDTRKTIKERLEEISCPCESIHMNKVIEPMDLAVASMSLLVCWGEVSERVAIQNHAFEVGSERSLINTANQISIDGLNTLSNDLKSFGPSRLILSLAAAPALSNHTLTEDWPKISNLNLISRFVAWFLNEDQINRDVFQDLAVNALKLISMSLLHTNLTAVQNRSSIDMSLSTDTFQFVGSQLRYALRSIFRKNSQGKSNDMPLLLNLLDFLQSSIYLQPSLAKQILSSECNETKVIDEIVKRVHIDETRTLSGILVTSSCAKVLSQLWKSCRENCESVGSYSVNIHPCDDLVSALSSDGTFYSTITSSMRKYDFVRFHRFDMESEKTKKAQLIVNYEASQKMDTIAYVIEIIVLELLLFLRHGEQQLPLVLKDFLVDTSGDLLKKWFESISYDSLKSCQDLGQQFTLSNVNFSESASSNASFAINVLNYMSMCNSNLSLNLKSYHSASKLVESQHLLIATLSQFGQVLHYYRKKAGSYFTSDMVLDELEQVVSILSEGVEISLSSISYVTSSLPQYIAVDIAEVANALMPLLVTSMSDLTVDQPGRVLTILEQIVQPIEKILGMSSSYINWNLSCEMRQNVMLSISLAIDIIKKGCELSHEDNNRFRKIQISCCMLACDTLRLLKEFSSSNTIEPHSNKREEEEFQHLLQTSISCIPLLLPNGVNSHDSLLFTHSYDIELSNAIRNGEAIPLIIYHLNVLSLTAANLDNNNEKRVVMDLIARMLYLIASLAESGNIELSQILLENHFISSLTRNPILLQACEKWTGLPQGKMRGYIQRKKDNFSIMDSREQIECADVDPVHEIWRFAIRTLVSLTRSTSSTLSKAFISSSIRQKHTAAVLDFLRTFERNFDSLLENFWKNPPLDTLLSSGCSSSGFGYTLASLNEVCDFMSLISELCSEGHKKFFESNQPQLFNKLSSAAVQTIMSLASFLGAIGTAREVFSAISTFEELKNSTVDQSETMRAMHEKIASHPLLAEGLLQGKHKAIHDAVYANNCCLCMTESDYMLSRSESKPESGTSSRNEFQHQVENNFLLLIEKISSQTILNTLSVMSKVHPVLTSFMTFSEVEASKLQLPPINPGTIVAIRPKKAWGNEILAQLNNVSTLSFARVTDFNSVSSTLDVEYLDSSNNSIERDVHISRLAGIEDSTKLRTTFEYYSAPESISQVSASHTSVPSIGHLIQILRWCRHHVAAERKDQDRYISKDIVTCIAETSSILLGNEMSLHLQLGSMSRANIFEVQSINRQLFDLFGEVNSLQNFDLSEPEAGVDSMEGRIDLKKKVDAKVWNSTQKQLEEPIRMAQEDIHMENIRKSNEQNGSSLGWNYSTSFRGYS